MIRKMYWGFAILILLIGIAAVFIIQHEISENRELKDKLAELEALANQINQRKISKNNPPPAEPGFKWVWHNDHWDKVPISNPNGPIAHHHVPIADVTTQNVQTSKENGQYLDGNKPIDEDFYRAYIKKYSRERLEAMIKSDQRFNEHLRAEIIPKLEEGRQLYLNRLEVHPNMEPYRKGLARYETQIQEHEAIIGRKEEGIRMASKVLNEEANNVEK